MITCDLVGPGCPGDIPNFGLGNQIFQIAAILSLAKDNNDYATFPKILDPDFGGYHNTIFHKLNTSLEEEITKWCEASDFSYIELPYFEGCCYKGYFQSEKYFSHNRGHILEKLEFPSVLAAYVGDKYKDILREETTSLHIRRGDYVSLDKIHPLQSCDYYYNAVESFPTSDRFLIFSDDINWCKENLNIPKSTYIEGESDVVDLLLMSLCKNNIIANSTFSWWGAWLNRNGDKKVIAPKDWFGPDSSLSDKDIVPDDWIKL
jgi:hypothetical protein